jgi:DNA repair protein RadC
MREDTSPYVSLNPMAQDGDTGGVVGFDRGIVQRVLTVGVRAASVVDLVAISFSRREEDVPLAEVPSRKMLQRFQSLRGLSEASRSDLQASTGLDDFEVLRAQALIELGRRMANAAAGPKETIDSAEDVMALMDHLRYEKREHFIAILLDTKNNVIRTAPIHVGTLNASIVGPREIFREAIRDGAASVILVHNHPSGDSTPSPEDHEVTQHLVKIGDMLDIPVVDHVVIGERRCFSFAESGLIRHR